ncbi:MAG: TonB-dependent receptor [Lysobacteraceae bacterium]
MNVRRNSVPRLGRCVLALVVGCCLASAIHARANEVVEGFGTIFGRAAPDTQVILINEETGERREVPVQPDGIYAERKLPIGSYRVSGIGGEGLARLEVRSGIRVWVGTATQVYLIPIPKCGEEGFTCLDGGPHTAYLHIAAPDSTNYLPVNRLGEASVQRDVTDALLLVPGAVRGDASFGNFASFGGSSIAENRYTLNGFNITDPNNGYQFAKLPFEGLAELAVMNGGLDAVHGGGTGAVINLTPTRGINDFMAGASLYWAPESLHEGDPDQFDGFGDRLANNRRDKGWEYTANLWASGPLIADGMSAYALLSWSGSQDHFYPGNRGNNLQSMSEDPSWMVKLDWEISHGHYLDFTAFSDRREVDNGHFATSFGDELLPARGAYLGTATRRLGGEIYVLNYSGQLTDDFRLSLLTGTGRFASGFRSISATGIRDEFVRADGRPTGGCPVISDQRANVDEPVTGCSFAGFSGLRDGGGARDQFGVAADWRLGAHQLSGGVDWERSWSSWGGTAAGGEYWIYYNGVDDTNIALQLIEQVAGRGEARQAGAYLQDRWQVTDDFTARFGLRWQRDRYATSAGDLFDAGTEPLPRLGFSWNLDDDRRLTLFGTAGRYSQPLPAATIGRIGAGRFYEQHSFTFTEVDPVTGVPLDPMPLFDILPLPGEAGLDVDPRTVASQNLKPILQDEFTLGLQKVLGDHVAVGLRAIHRDLKRGIESSCDDRPIVDSAQVVIDPAISRCRLFNPGSDAVFLVDTDGDGRPETFRIGADEVWQTGNDFDIPAGTRKLPGKAKRSYRAVELFAEGKWDRLWWQGSYVWSKSRGNTEVGVNSVSGEAFFITADFDYPERDVGAHGLLPNDRRHSLKLFGSVDINDQWSLGGNLLLQSGRPYSCLSFSSGVGELPPSGSYFSCGTVTSRGAAGRTPWQRTLDLNLRYAPSIADGNLRFQIDVFNVFNERTAVEVHEYSGSAINDPQAGDINSSNAPRPFLFGQATDWQAPRSVQFSVRYTF